MNTRRYPRTLQEAFGPYTSNHIEEPKERRYQDWAVWAVVAFFVSLVLAGVIR